MVCVELDIEDGELGSAVRERMEHAGHVVGGDSPATIITDSALRAMQHLKRAPTLVLADATQIPAAVAAMRAGAFGYVYVPLLPGELELMVERALAGWPPHPQGDPLPLAALEARYILAVLHRFRGNQTRAAKTLGIGRNTLWRKLRRHEDPKSPQP